MFVAAVRSKSAGEEQYTGVDRFGRVVEQRWVNTSTSTNTDDFLYTYDRDGNSLTRNNGLNSSFNEQYGYDGLNQMTSFSRGTHSQSWSLDAVGNWPVLRATAILRRPSGSSVGKVTRRMNSSFLRLRTDEVG